MPLRNSATHYGQVARALHWTSVALMLMSIMLGAELQAMTPADDKTLTIARHASYGLLLMAVLVLRYAWRLANLNPVLSYTLPAWQRRSAISLHWFLYAAVFSQCGIGLAQLVTGSIDIAVFDVTLVRIDGPVDGELAARLNDVHAALANLIYCAIAVHVSAALYHQVFGVRDPVRP